MERFVKRVMDLAGAVAARANLNHPSVTEVHVLEGSARPPKSALAVTEGSFIVPEAGAIYVVKADPSLLVLRLTAAYFALAMWSTYGTFSPELAAEMARQNYFLILVNALREYR
uniref:Uncharacterized protein n=1 Tax=Thermofilum pendens TaxID=2269 RepID=A0A7J3X9P5_THEPE